MSVRRNCSISWLAVVAICAASTILIFLVLSDALSKNAGVPITLFLGVLIIGWVAFELFLNRDGRHKSYFSMLRSPARIARFGLVMIGGPLAISQALPLFEPGPLTPRDVEKAVVKGLQIHAAASSSNAGILEKINGVWGEFPNCDVVSYRFAVDGKALRIKSERRPNGTKAYDENAHIEGTGDNDLSSSAVGDGQTANFRLETIADTDWLIWTTRGEQPSPVRLMRCNK
jgi:hypothetical protein